ncbi:HAD family hydrolase [candidate division KSB1 bacterium]|nr:MAG: HAD family hydrolase [candidate division KSB1 bacterium]RKY80285.1 MAG: HAD family hydrolase [candidate division KSB1 bacterium]RKY85289.1 MAG: HAD family hydrolase [candidate division KSB1 bacterium]RKY88322.1 MAG: HAD family hydrolase [candidate division KSB1 bacterium]RKY91796.1 MAG: HAD family hydrolase [candidate division KSB1 bacterium]
MNRQDALTLLHEYTKNENLIKHELAVEAAMRAYARKFGEDEEKWGIVGLLHDFDYEQYPDMTLHAKKGAEILREKGYPEDIVYAIHAHNEYHGLPRKSLLDKTLYAVDELCGFLVAVALVRPTKKIAEVEIKSVKKKMKDKSFARQVNREEIRKGAEELGMDLDEHIGIVLEAMKGIAEELGL